VVLLAEQGPDVEEIEPLSRVLPHDGLEGRDPCARGGFLLAAIETMSAKMRIFRAPEFLGTAFMLAVLAMLIHALLEG